MAYVRHRGRGRRAQRSSHPDGGFAPSGVPGLRLGRDRRYGSWAPGPSAHRRQGQSPAGSASIAQPISGSVGIAHTRWATHGVPTTENAHPHISRGGVAIVHNGIIENHEALRAELKSLGYSFTSETDTEVIAHRIHHHLGSSPDLLAAVRKTVAELQGAYALAVVSEADPECIVMAREGCPAVIGLGIDENFAASDVAALLPVTRRFMFWKKAMSPRFAASRFSILDAAGKSAVRAVRESDLPADAVERGPVPALHAQGNPRAAAGDRRKRWRSGSPAANYWMPPSVPAPPRFSSASKRFTSPPAARVFTRASSPAI